MAEDFLKFVGKLMAAQKKGGQKPIVRKFYTRHTRSQMRALLQEAALLPHGAQRAWLIKHKLTRSNLEYWRQILKGKGNKS